MLYAKTLLSVLTAFKIKLFSAYFLISSADKHNHIAEYTKKNQLYIYISIYTLTALLETASVLYIVPCEETLCAF